MGNQKGWSEIEKWAPHVLQSWATADNTVCSATRFGEEFWNCADISVVASGSPMQPTPNPPIQQDTPMPTAAVTPDPSFQTELEPEPASTTPVPQHSGESEACGSVWEQCGGVYWTGATCCDGDNLCHRQSQWYSQCIPPSQSLLQGANAQSGPRWLKIHRRHASDQILFQRSSALAHDQSEL